jgi:hypothetical protein
MATVAKPLRTTTYTLASAGAGPFLVGFRLFDLDRLEVYVGGAQRTDFVITSAFLDGYDDTATITFDAPLLIGAVIQIDGALVPHREADYLNGDPGLARKMNIELARLWSSVSEISMKVGRAVRGFEQAVPFTPEIGKTIVFTADGFIPGPTVAEINTAQESAILAAADAEQVALDLVATDADTVATAADRVQTTADAVATAADRVQTGLDKTTTTADRVQTGLDRTQTAADRVQTDLDRTAVAADRSTVAADKATTIAAKDAAMLAFANFEDVYLGPYPTDPTLDNDGSALEAGDLYYDTANNVMKVWLGAAWGAAYISAAGVLMSASNLSDLVDVPAARVALGLGTAATTNITVSAMAPSGGADGDIWFQY